MKFLWGSSGHKKQKLPTPYVQFLKPGLVHTLTVAEQSASESQTEGPKVFIHSTCSVIANVTAFIESIPDYRSLFQISLYMYYDIKPSDAMESGALGL